MKKSKVEKGKVSNGNDGNKKTRRSVEKEVISGEEEADEETIEEAKETEEEEEEEEVEVEMVVKDAKVTTTNTGRRSRQDNGKANTQSGDLVGKQLVDFQNNFNLATSAVPGTNTLNSVWFCNIILVDNSNGRCL